MKTKNEIYKLTGAYAVSRRAELGDDFCTEQELEKYISGQMDGFIPAETLLAWHRAKRLKIETAENAIKTELDQAKEKAFNAHKAAQRAALQVELIRTKLLRFRAANGLLSDRI